VEKAVIKPVSEWAQWQSGGSQHPACVNSQHSTDATNCQAVYELKHCEPRRTRPDEVLTHLYRFRPDKFNGWPYWTDVFP
jgi:hypothetical protein